MEITDTTIFLSVSLNHLCPVSLNKNHMNIDIIIPKAGRRVERKSLKSTVEGVKATTLLFSKNQSKERNDSDVVPAFSTGPNAE